MAQYVAAVDQGTTSTRFMVFDHDGREVGRHQLEHEQIMPRSGWVEHNPLEIWDRTHTVLGTAMTSRTATTVIVTINSSRLKPCWRCGAKVMAFTSNCRCC